MAILFAKYRAVDLIFMRDMESLDLALRRSTTKSRLAKLRIGVGRSGYLISRLYARTVPG